MSEAADAVAELAGQTQNLMDLMSSMQQLRNRKGLFRQGNACLCRNSPHRPEIFFVYGSSATAGLHRLPSQRATTGGSQPAAFCPAPAASSLLGVYCLLTI